MFWTIIKLSISAVIIVIVSEVSQAFPRLGALLLTLPIISILAFAMSWQQNHDLPAISKFARETLILVPLGLPFFVPLAFAENFGLGFWSSMVLGSILASIVIGLWFNFGPTSI